MTAYTCPNGHEIIVPEAMDDAFDNQFFPDW